MFVTELRLTDFRNYAEARLSLGAGVTVFVGPNGQGKTNLVEAVEYLSTMSSHRVSNTVPLVRAGADTAILGATVQAGLDDDRRISVELELAPGRSSQARLNRAPVPRPRESSGRCAPSCSRPSTWRSCARSRPIVVPGWIRSS